MVGPRRTDLVTACMLSWKMLKKSGYDIMIWDDQQLAQFIKQNYPMALPAFLNARNYAEAADIARYLVVYHFGGCYVDWDIQLLDATKFVQIMEESPAGFLIIDPINDTLASECFSALKGEPYLLSLIGDIIELYKKKLRDGIFTPQYSGPYRMRDSLARHKNSGQRLISVKEIFLFDYTEIRNKPERDTDAPLIHYWMHSWLKEEK